MGTEIRTTGDGGTAWDDSLASPQRGPRVRSRAVKVHEGAKQASNDRLANFLGWFSIGLGAAEVLIPGTMARVVGIDDDDENRRLLRGLGLRELTSGIGILSQERRAEWLWSRVAGDAMDLAFLGKALGNGGNERARTAAATAAVLGVAALDVAAARQARERAASADNPLRHVFATQTIQKTPDELYAFWRDLSNLPRFMQHLESVRVLDDRRSHWVAKAPAGKTVEWDAVITEDRPGELIAWQSADNADVFNKGEVRFESGPRGRGSVVTVELDYDPPAGAVGVTIAKLFSEEPDQQVHADLRHFKQVMETGEVIYSDASLSKGPHPAQPRTRSEIARLRNR